MILPSSVASYGSVPLIDLDHYDLQSAQTSQRDATCVGEA